MAVPRVLGKARGTLPGRDRRGIVLVVALMVVMLTAVLGSAFITVSGTEHQIARNDQDVTQALDVAEAGVQTALNDLNLGNPPTAGGTLGPGEFTATVTAAAPPAGQQRIVAVGFVPTQAAPRAIRRIDVLVMRPTPFQWGAYGRDSVAMSGGGTTDSYDSMVAGYDLATAGSNGDVGSNGNISLSGGPTTLNGDVTAGGTVSISGGSTVTGTTTENAPPVDLAEVPCPGGGFAPFVPIGPGVNYNPASGDLNVSGGYNLVLPVPPTSYHFRNVTLSGGSTLTLAPGANHVDIYIARDLNITGGVIVNTSAQPTQLSIWGCGADTSNWVISGGSGSYFALYAPNHRVDFSGGGSIWGSIVASELRSTGGAEFHYDEALGRLRGNPNKYAIQPWSWTELIP